MKLRKRVNPEEGFQMAPMIDMVFLLLVFFMCVSSMASAEKSVELELPRSEQSKIPEDLSDRGTVSIDPDGRIYVGTRVVSLEGLKESIHGLLSLKPDARVVIRADESTPYREVKKVLKTCAEAGAYRIVYATYER